MIELLVLVFICATSAQELSDSRKISRQQLIEDVNVRVHFNNS